MRDTSIENLLALIGDSGRGLRQHAAERIMMLGLERCYPAIEKAVRNDADADLRNGAMEALVAFDGQAVPKLVKLLLDDNEEVRNFSAVMLGAIGSRESVVPLIAALRDPDANVRHGAAEALGKIGDRRAEQPLRELSTGDSWDRWYALAALADLAAVTA